MWEWDLSGSESNVQWGEVAEDTDEDSLKAETEVSEHVNHTLLGKGQVSSLANHQVGPLDANDRAEVSGLGELEGFGRVADWPIIRDIGKSVEAWPVVV